MYKIGEFSKVSGFSKNTLRLWDKEGELKPAYVSEKGHRFYSEEQLNRILGKKKPEKQNRITLGYCNGQTNNAELIDKKIENMKTYLLAKGEPFSIIYEIESQQNYNRQDLRRIIKNINDNKVSTLVLLTRDELTSEGFEIIEYLAYLHDTKIEIIDNTK